MGRGDPPHLSPAFSPNEPMGPHKTHSFEEQAVKGTHLSRIWARQALS